MKNIYIVVLFLLGLSFLPNLGYAMVNGFYSSIQHSLDFGTYTLGSGSGTIQMQQNGTTGSVTSGNATQSADSNAGAGWIRYTSQYFNGGGASVSISSPTTLTNSSGATISFGLNPNVTGDYISISTGQNIDKYYGGYISYTSSVKPGIYTGSITFTYSTYGSYESNTIPVQITLLAPPITITQTYAMQFGNIGPELTGGTIRMNPFGSLSNVSGAAKIPAVANSAGVFAITGGANTPVTITVSSNNALSGPSSGVSITNPTLSLTSPITLDSTGNASIQVGMDLVYPAGVQAGAYSGTYTITANY